MPTRLRLGSTRQKHNIISVTLDFSCWLLAVMFATVLRFDFTPELPDFLGYVIIGAIAGVSQVSIGYWLYLYRDRYPLASFAEVRMISFASLITMVVVSVPVLIFGPHLQISRSIVFIAAPIALAGMTFLRAFARIGAERFTMKQGETPVIIVGAGRLGSRVVTAIQNDVSTLRAVCFVDDDFEKHNLEIYGVRVRGTLQDLPRLITEYSAEIILIAISNLEPSENRRILEAIGDIPVKVQIVPNLSQIMSAGSRLEKSRDMSVEDLLGRRPITSEQLNPINYLQGKKVLVTGAGGSIGTELCKQIAMLGPSEMYFLDHDETGLQQAQLAVTGQGLLTSGNLILVDVRDSDVINRIFMDIKPDVVFHAAALKHLTLLENFPAEAWKSNVLGTLNVLKASVVAGVKQFVNISTDKAANPTSILGRSKAMTEGLTSWYAQKNGRNYVSVRFGNVLASRGSLIPTWQSQIESGGPLTVTHPEMTRFFMTIPEACNLVLQAGGIGQPGEVMVLDMGEQVKILDVANYMIKLSGKPIEIIFTGIRPGEKLHEELFGCEEEDERPHHPLISHVAGAPINPAMVREGSGKILTDFSISINDLAFHSGS